MAAGASGMIGLGQSQKGILSQLSTTVGGVSQTFAVCMAGAVFFGAGPYVFLPGKEISHRLLYTPLLINPESTGPSHRPGVPFWEYFVRVKLFMVPEKPVPGIDPSLLVIEPRGFGGTKVSTTAPYTVLQSTIYRTLAGAFEGAPDHGPLQGRLGAAVRELLQHRQHGDREDRASSAGGGPDAGGRELGLANIRRELDGRGGRRRHLLSIPVRLIEPEDVDCDRKEAVGG